MIQTHTALKNVDTSYNIYYSKNGDVCKPMTFFPYTRLNKLMHNLNIGVYLERTYCLKEVIKVAYYCYDAKHSFKLKPIYDEVSANLGKNPYTIQANVRLCIQDIIDNAPENLLHSIFYISRKDANKNVNPKYFIVQILDYLNSGVLF